MMIIFPSVAFLAFLLVHHPADGEVVTLKVFNLSSIQVMHPFLRLFVKDAAKCAKGQYNRYLVAKNSGDVVFAWAHEEEASSKAARWKMDRDFGVDIGVVPGKLPFTFKTKFESVLKPGHYLVGLGEGYKPVLTTSTDKVFDVQFDPGTGQAKAMLQQSFAPSLFGPTCGLALSWWEMRRAECGCGRVERVEYEQPKGRLVSLPPEVVSTTTVDNRGGSTNYSQRFSRTVTLTSSSHYDHTAGVAIKVGTKFSAGIPVVGEGEISAEVSGHYSHTWGHSETKTTTETHTFLCPAPPYKKVVCKAVVHSRKLEVPYRMTLGDPGGLSGCARCTSSGIWTGVRAVNVNVEIDTIEGY